MYARATAVWAAWLSWPYWVPAGGSGTGGPPGDVRLGDPESGPASLADGGVNTTDPAQIVNAKESFHVARAVGLRSSISRQPELRISDIKDGSSNTYLAGEKNVGPDWYATGESSGDNHAAQGGDDEEIQRWTADLTDVIVPVSVSNEPSHYSLIPPMPDTPGLVYQSGFGSAHATGFHMAFCDGAVRMLNYSIDRETHRRLSNRSDGLTIDAKSF